MTSELLKIAFGLSELLNNKFPETMFRVISGLLVDSSEVKSAAVYSDKYQVMVTDDRIALSVSSPDKEKHGPFEIDMGDGKMQLDVSLDHPIRHVFDLPDPQAIDKVVEIIGKDLRGETWDQAQP